MMAFIRPRLRKPAWIVLGGTVFAAAWVASQPLGTVDYPPPRRRLPISL